MTLATQEEAQVAAQAAQALIRATEGERLIVLKEAMAMLVALYCANRRARGDEDPQEEAQGFMAEVLTRGLHYDRIGLISRAH